MTTSDERREVAEILRECAREVNGTRDFSMYLSHWVGIDDADRTDDEGKHFTVKANRREAERTLEKLADLIDPTCKVSSVETYDDELGQLEGWEFHLTCGHSFQQPWNEPPAYCPECGARVVDEDAD